MLGSGLTLLSWLWLRLTPWLERTKSRTRLESNRRSALLDDDLAPTSPGHRFAAWDRPMWPLDGEVSRQLRLRPSPSQRRSPRASPVVDPRSVELGLVLVSRRSRSCPSLLGSTGSRARASWRVGLAAAALLAARGLAHDDAALADEADRESSAASKRYLPRSVRACSASRFLLRE